MNATTFPLPLSYHIVLCVLGCVFFLIQFLHMKKPYQLLMAIAMPVSLLIYIQPENHTLFYAVGLVVAILLFLALASSIVLRFRNKKKPQQEEQAS